MRKTILIFSCCAFFALAAMAQRTEALLEKNWKFTKGDVPEATQTNLDDSKWETVTIPHDWAIFGPFDRNNDLQEVAVTQDLEKQASVKTGRTGGLPYVGVGWYRTAFDASADKQVTLVFDGAMSEARVYVNGKEACFWPFGYNSFHCDVTGLLNADGKNNVLAVRLENRPQSSRWYPGAGLYRNVRLVTTERVHVPVWGTQLTTPHVSAEYASVRLRTTIRNAGDADVRISTDIIAPDGKIVARKDNSRKINHGQPFEQNFLINAPSLWSPETPYLYKAVSKIYVDGKQTDEYTTRFGIRSIEIIADKGFFLNGKHRKFQGVCNHHDLGPLGAAVNVAALRRQLMIGKIIGIGLVGVAQLAIWAVLIIVLLAVAGGISGSSPELMGGASGLLAALQGLNLAKMGGLFVLNFIGGYLVYASIFAAIGAAINGQEDSQQFMMPIVLLLIFALYAGIYSSDNPDGPLAIWCSMIPFTSPIVMMVRLPFDVPVWETMLSVVILYVAAFGMIWIAGKIYRVGILMYGKKPSFKEMIRWITYK